MALVDPLPGLIESLQEKIVADFGLATREPAESAEILTQVGGMILIDALVRAEEFLEEAEKTYVDLLLKAAEDEPEKVVQALQFMASRVPELGSLLEAAYQDGLNLALEVAEQAREKKFEDAEKSAEAVDDLLGFVEDQAELAAVNVPGLSVFSMGVSLLFDPARFRRSPRERQKRLFKQASVLFANVLSVAWFGLAFFTICDALNRHNVIPSLPEFIKGAVPNWYEQQSTGGQVLSLIISAAAVVLVVFIVTVLFARAGTSRRLTPAFELKVDDDELASTVLKPMLLSVFPSGVPESTLWGLCKTVYRSIYINSGKPNSEDLKILEEILNGANEKAAVAFLKSKIRRYRSAMQYKAKELGEDTATMMSRIR